MHSIVQTRGHVSFPAFTGERIYMRPFHQRDGLPFDLRRWQSTIDQMLDGVDTAGRELYLMVDQTIVAAGQPQRRPGIHIDGYWIPGVGWKDDEKNKGDWRTLAAGYETHRTVRGLGVHDTDKHIARAGLDGWSPEGLLLASDVIGCEAFDGAFSGKIGTGGDCSHIQTMLRRHTLAAGRVHALNVTGLHQSIPMVNGGARTLVRLNVPGWSPEHAGR